MDVFRFEPLAVRHLEQLTQHALTGARGVFCADDSEMVTAIGDFDIEPALDLTKVFVELAAQVGEPGIVLGLEYQVAADCGVGQSVSRTLSYLPDGFETTPPVAPRQAPIGRKSPKFRPDRASNAIIRPPLPCR